jgi:hypothetical protein
MLNRSRRGAPFDLNCGSSASHEMEDDRNDRQYQKNMDKERGDMENKESSQPQQEQYQT